MIVPMIDTLSENDSFDNNFLPATENGAKIMFFPQDGIVSEFEVDVVEQMDSYANNNEIMFRWKELDIPKWKVFITDSRIVVWNPYSKGLVGKPKEKQGKSTGGHLLYGGIMRLGAWLNKDKGAMLAGICYRDNGSRRTMFILNGDEDSLRRIAEELNKRINHYIDGNNNRLSEDSDYFKKNPNVINEWNSFPNDIYKNKDEEVNVMVPMKSFVMAPNGRLQKNV